MIKKDTILISTIVGLGATTIDIMIGLLLKLSGIIKTPLFLYVAKLSLVDVPAPKGLVYLIGLITHLGVGALFAFVFVLLLQKWGEDYIYLKGAVFGISFLWIFRVVIIPNLITSGLKLKLSASSQPYHIITSIIWGLAASYIYAVLTKRYMKAS